MEEDKISRTQLMALMWAGILAPVAELLPALLLPGAGRGAWLAAALAAPVVLAAGWVMGSLAGREGLARGVRALRDGAWWVFLLAAAAAVLWMGRGQLAAFARTGQLFLAALLATAGVVLLLSLFQGRPERLLPLWWEDARPVIQASLSAAGVMGWGLFLPFLMGSVRDQGENKNWHWLFWGLGGTLLLAASQAVILANLGAGLAGRLENPFFALAKSVGVEGAFQRVEGVVTALWTFADLAMGGILVFALRAVTAELISPKRLGWVPWVAVLLSATGAVLLFPTLGAGEEWNRRLVPMGNLILGLVLPAALLLIKKLIQSKERYGTSCGDNLK